MKKRFLGLTLTLCIMMTIIPSIPTKVHAEVSGICGDNFAWLPDENGEMRYKCDDNVKWTLDESGILTISGTGKMSDFRNTEGVDLGVLIPVWYEYHDKIKKVVINDGVTNIGGGAFRCLDNLLNVTIPDSVTQIEGRAFEICDKLTNITIPKNVKYIETYGFAYRCPNLKSINVDSDNTNYCSVDGVLFNKDKTSLIAYPEGKTDEVYNIPEGVKNIENEAFYDSINLSKVTMQDGIMTIGDHAFSNCTNLMDVTLPYGMKDIGEYAFGDCNLTNIIVPEGIMKITSFVFAYCYNLQNLTISNSIRSIEYGAFIGCDNLKNVYYSGTESEWNKIQIGNENDALKNATIHFNIKPTPIPTIMPDTIPAPTLTPDVDSEITPSMTPIPIPTPELGEMIDKNHNIAEFTVVDATTQIPLDRASIIVTDADGKDITIVTDKEGKASKVLPIGKLTAAVIKNGYLTRNIKFTVANSKTQIPVIGLSTKPVVDAKVNVREMTKEEIVEAGIDITATKNQHVYEYKAELSFNAGIDILSIISYFGDTGISLPTKPFVSNTLSENKTPYYHAKSIENKNTYIASPTSPAAATLSDGTKVTIFPVSERFYLIIYGEVKWLKEMFDVEMLVTNTSLTDTIDDCTAELTLPDGLSLPTLNREKQSNVQSIEHIAEGSSASVQWYVRGDKEGTYNVKATLDGKMMPFEEEFHYEYVAENPIKVYAGSALHMKFIVPEAAFHGEDYPVKIELENISVNPIYGLSHQIKNITQGQITHYSDGTEKEVINVDKDNLGKISADEFLPGDKLVIEINTNIMFDSEIMKYFKNSITGGVDKLSQIMDMIDAYLKVVDIVNATYNLCNDVVTNLDKTLTLADALNDELKKEYEKTKKAALEFIKKLENYANETGANLPSVASFFDEYEKLNIRLAEGDFEELTLEEIKEIRKSFEAMHSALEISKSSEENKKFDIYEAIKVIIAVIPIKYYLNDIIMTTLEGSTTEIPYSIETTPVEAKYFGCENISRYLYALLIAGLGEMDLPGYLSWMPDTLGYDKAVDYINGVVEKMSSISAKASTGETSFKAWVEVDGVRADASSFTLSSSAEGAKFLNGELTFNGGGIIGITPHVQSDAILYIENGDGTVTTYTIKVHPEHECSSNVWMNATLPVESAPAVKVKYCDICSEIVDFEKVKTCENHSYSDFITEVESTDEKAGVVRKTCVSCGVYKSKIVDDTSSYAKKFNFADVQQSEWFYNAVKFAYENKITVGVSENLFAPMDNVTRGQFITMLCRAYGISEMSGNNFDDAGNTWYTGFLAAAKQLGISSGVGDNKFAPDKEITREEMVMLIYNYWESTDKLDNSENNLNFTDKNSISDWAKSGVSYMNGKGYVKGKGDNVFDSKGNATRAEIAQLFFNILGHGY